MSKDGYKVFFPRGTFCNGPTLLPPGFSWSAYPVNLDEIASSPHF